MPPMKTQTLTLHQLSSMLYVNRHIFQYVVGARGALSSLQFCPTQSRSHKHSYIASMHTRIHNFRYSNQHKQIAKETGSDVCLHEDTHTQTHSKLVTWAAMCAILWMTELILGHQVHLHIFTFLTASAHLIFFSLTNVPAVCVCVCVRECVPACAQNPPVNVCVIVCYYRGEREKLVFFKEHPQN